MIVTVCAAPPSTATVNTASADPAAAPTAGAGNCPVAGNAWLPWICALDTDELAPRPSVLTAGSVGEAETVNELNVPGAIVRTSAPFETDATIRLGSRPAVSSASCSAAFTVAAKPVVVVLDWVAAVDTVTGTGPGLVAPPVNDRVKCASCPGASWPVVGSAMPPMIVPPPWPPSVTPKEI